MCPTGTGDMIVDFLLVFHHQVQTNLTMQRPRRFLRASSLFAEDLPDGTETGPDREIQKIVAKTQGRLAETFTVHSEDPEVCRGATSCSETE